MHVVRIALITALSLVGCKGGSTEKKATGSAAMPAPAGSAAGSSSPAAGSGSGAGSGSQPAEDPKVREAYRQGMRKGRKAAAAKSYKDAIAGFDEALAAKKNDARALGERGFVRLLEGTDLDGATKDFDLAAGATKDPKLLSEIWFNRGLVEEKRGKTDNALAAFTIANSLRPTKAAQAKLGDKAACQVTTGTPGDHQKLIEGADWLALGKSMAHSDEGAPTTPAEALLWLTGNDKGTEPTLPTVVAASDVLERTVWVVWKNGASMRAFPVAMAMGGRCSGRADATIVSANATHLHVRATEELEGGSTYVCQGKGDEIVECEDKPGEVSLGTACLGGATTLRDVVIEIATGKVVAQLEQPEAKPATIELVATGLKISGNGCDRTEALAK
jgi:hypothetical protein